MREEKPNRFVEKLVGVIIGIVLSVFLLRLAIRWFLEIWWILLILAAVGAAILIGYRIWKNRSTI